ncbi:MAG: hypothetical protein ACFE8B_05735 [Candidatus Hermodarchaeota archaeon]
MTNQEKSDSVYSEYFNIIQNVISRMAQNSFLIKAWLVTIVAAIIVLTFSMTSIIVFVVLMIITIIFWTLDSYYLKIERLYRHLYIKKVEEYNNEEERKKMKLFDLDFRPFIEKEKKVPRIMVSKSEILFYSPIFAALVIFLITTILNNL